MKKKYIQPATEQTTLCVGTPINASLHNEQGGPQGARKKRDDYNWDDDDEYVEYEEF